MLNIKKNLRKSFFFLENLHFETWHDNYNESDNDILKCKEKKRILKLPVAQAVCLLKIFSFPGKRQ